MFRITFSTSLTLSPAGFQVSQLVIMPSAPSSSHHDGFLEAMEVEDNVEYLLSEDPGNMDCLRGAISAMVCSLLGTNMVFLLAMRLSLIGSCGANMVFLLPLPLGLKNVFLRPMAELGAGSSSSYSDQVDCLLLGYNDDLWLVSRRYDLSPRSGEKATDCLGPGLPFIILTALNTLAD